MPTKPLVLVLLIVCVCWIESSAAYGLFGFDVHHRYSDAVKDFLDVEGLPAKGSLGYYAAMAHRDHLTKARRLATTPAASSPFLTFLGGNETFRLDNLGFLYYSLVTVGTPPVSFLVALDTGSDLFWLPCACNDCARSFNLTSRKSINLNQYNPNESSTSSLVPCNSTMCGLQRACDVRRNACAYQEVYLSSNTSSTGILVDDILVMATDDSTQTPVKAPITLGCGIIETGDFIDKAAINGLFGLGLDTISVPSILASKGFAPNAFSMCFGPDEVGRIEFGDKGTPDQRTTPINVESVNPSYNISATQITVGRNTSNVAFTAIFDSGTSFTLLSDPAYSVIAKGFDSIVTEPRYQPQRGFIFEYCYSLSATQGEYFTPYLNLTLKGGDVFAVTNPTVVVPRDDGLGDAYCLAIIKSEDINIIGQNFMTGYRIVFDREEMTLGWTEADCYDDGSGTNTPPINKGNAPPPSTVYDPVATPAGRNKSSVSSPPPPPPPSRLPLGVGAAPSSSMVSSLLLLLVSMFFHHFILS